MIQARTFLLLRALLTILAVAASFQAREAGAHEARPAYLQINEIAPDRYDVLWRTPVLAGMHLPVTLRFPPNVHNVTEPIVREIANSLVERRVIDGIDLAGKRIELVGLQATITDVLVRVQLLDGHHSTTLVHPSRPWIDIAAAQGNLTVATTFLIHGVEHILFGYDHLLFVLALI